MSLDIQRQKLFSTCYGSDPCDDIKVSQSTIDFIRESILKEQTKNPQKPISNLTSNLASRWNIDSEQYSGNVK